MLTGDVELTIGPVVSVVLKFQLTEEERRLPEIPFIPVFTVTVY
jgi:hypothetical protein